MLWKMVKFTHTDHRGDLFPLILQRVKKVIGIELCQEAVQDAKANAQINGELSWNAEAFGKE